MTEISLNIFSLGNHITSVKTYPGHCIYIYPHTLSIINPRNTATTVNHFSPTSFQKSELIILVISLPPHSVHNWADEPGGKGRSRSDSSTGGKADDEAVQKRWDDVLWRETRGRKLRLPGLGTSEFQKDVCDKCYEGGGQIKYSYYQCLWPPTPTFSGRNVAAVPRLK